MTLASPLPEVLNLRERKLHGPDETSRGFGILTKNRIPKVGLIGNIRVRSQFHCDGCHEHFCLKMPLRKTGALDF